MRSEPSGRLLERLQASPPPAPTAAATTSCRHRDAPSPPPPPAGGRDANVAAGVRDGPRGRRGLPPDQRARRCRHLHPDTAPVAPAAR